MSDLRFAGTGQDRRRRMLAADLEPLDATELAASVSAPNNESSVAAFPLLSRDDVMRKIISPRLWKHNVVACLLIAMPFLIAGFRLPGQDRTQVDQIDTAIRGLCGLELFIASQLCLLICWVRSASAVDFAGIFRAWRWMSLVLLASALLIVTNLTAPVTDLFATWLEQAIGNIRAARPALLFVPLCASGVLVLRHILPDMGRCRIAQGSLAIAAFLVLARIASSVRGPQLSSTTLELWELLVCGLVLSSVHMHCRYVIYVNPNPPAVKKSSSVKAKPSARIEDVESKSDAASPTISIAAAVVEKQSASKPEPVADNKKSSEQNDSLHDSSPMISDADDNARSAASSRKSASKQAKSSKTKRRAG